MISHSVSTVTYYIYHLRIILSSDFQVTRYCSACLFIISYNIHTSNPLELPSRLSLLGTMKNITIKTYLEKDKVTATTNNLWLHSFITVILKYYCMFHGRYIHLIHYSFHYSNGTFIYFLREIFPLCVSSLICLKILYTVTRLVNFLS